MIDLFGIKKLKRVAEEYKKLNDDKYKENQELKKEVKNLKLELKLAKMYINDDEAIAELLERKKERDRDYYALMAQARAGMYAAQQNIGALPNLGPSSGLLGGLLL